MKMWLICGALTVAITTPAWSQSTLTSQAIELYGGGFSSDCSNSAAPRLHVVADALTIEHGTKRITGHDVQTDYTFYGRSSPPTFEVVLQSQVRDGAPLLFIVNRDKSGQYITLEGGPEVEVALGKTLLGRKYRHCGAPNKRATAAPAVAADADSIILPFTLLKDARFKSAYHTALGPRTKVAWLARLEGPSSALEEVTIGGKEYTVAQFCKDHDCGDNYAIVLYSAAQGVVFGKILEQRQSVMIGAPPPLIAAELERLWTAARKQTP
jgi:Inhibitor of vertebrate lysozyme (Ivy)